MNDIRLTIPALRDAYAKGVSPVDVIEEVFARIEAVDDPGIFIFQFDKAEVIEAAKALGDYDPAKPLWGVPFAIKDNIDAALKPTTAACPAFTYEADRDAFAVARLKEAGALLIGKTNLDQFATGLVGLRSPFPPPKNAIDPQIVPGGSSSGSAVAVGHGIVSFALGTDTAGSGRVPAALNNIVGLKPTLGAVSTTGVVPACRTLDTISIFALTVDDAYSAFQAAAVYDPSDSYARDISAPAMTEPASKPKIAIPSADTIRVFGDAVQAASFHAGIELLKQTGAEIKEIDFKVFYDIADMLYYGAWVAERYAVIEELITNTPDVLHPVTRQIIGSGKDLTAADAFRGMYRLKDLIRAAEPELAKIDMLCVPTIPTFYSVEDLEADPITPNSNFGTYTNFVNLMDMCGIAVPTPARSDGRPGSVTLLARAGQDATVAALALKLEAVGNRKLGATDWDFSASENPLSRAEPDSIRLAVCGAHMTDLPLNEDLTTRGARFVCKSKTSADYRFFALAGGPPFRPGLVRVTDGQGSEIAIEIWEMPTENFGSFVKTIPAPLGIGTVVQARGDTVQGFLCEEAGLAGAKDITDIGDWRLFMQGLVTQDS